MEIENGARKSKLKKKGKSAPTCSKTTGVKTLSELQSCASQSVRLLPLHTWRATISGHQNAHFPPHRKAPLVSAVGNYHMG